jgi:hypothetical protein
LHAGRDGKNIDGFSFAWRHEKMQLEMKASGVPNIGDRE